MFNLKVALMCAIFIAAVAAVNVDYQYIHHDTWVELKNPIFSGDNLPRMGFKKSLDRPKKIYKTLPHNVNLPTNFDAAQQWPQCPTIGAIQNQAECGSCWAFGAIESISDRFCIHKNESVQLSFQDLITCDNQDNGCEGGDPYTAYKYVQKNGVVTSNCQPYTIPTCPPAQQPCMNFVNTPPCSAKCANSSVNFQQDLHHLKTVYAVKPNVAAIQNEIVTNGPVEACFEVYEDFLGYKSGVYTHKSGKDLGGHCIKIVGFGVSNGTPYWICNNSWTTSWGNNGIFWIEAGKNECVALFWAEFFDSISITKQNNRKHFKWSEILDQPQVLASHNYLDQLKQCLSKINISGKKVQSSIIMTSIKYGSIDMLAYLLNRFKVDLNSVEILNSNRYTLKDEIYQQEQNEPCDYINSIYCYAFHHGRIDIAEYLTERFKSYQWNYYRAMVKSPLSKSLEVVRYIVNKYNSHRKGSRSFQVNSDLGVNVFETAAFVGQIEMFEYLVSEIQNDLQQSRVYKFAILGGNIHFIEYLLCEYRDLASKDKHLIDYASNLKRFDIVGLLFRNGISECSSIVMNNAAEEGDLETLKLVHENTTVECSSSAIDLAAMNGHLECIKWFDSNRTEEFSTSAMDYAAMNGHLECIKWLHSNRSEGGSIYAMDYAAGNGHFETVWWLHYNRTEGCSDQAIDCAAGAGHLDIMKSLNSKRTEGFTYNSFWQSIDNNVELEVIQWLHENCTTEYFNAGMLDMAAYNKRFDILKFLIETNGEQWSDKLIDNAIIGGDLNIVKWVFENGYSNAFTDKTIELATDQGHIDIISGLNVNVAINNAITKGNLEILNILWTYNTPQAISYENYIELAIEHEHFDILKWIYENIENSSAIVVPITFFSRSIEKGNLPLAIWIYEHTSKPNTLKIKSQFKMDEFKRQLFRHNHFESIEWILETFKDITYDTLKGYKQILETNYPNSIESIQCLFLNHMDTKLFLRVFNNRLLREYICSKVTFIHVDLFKQNIYKWNHVIISPSLMAGNNYIQLLKDYFVNNNNDNNDKKNKWYHNFIKSNKISIKKERYLVNVIASVNASILYLEKHIRDYTTSIIDYRQIVEIAPYSRDKEMFQWVLSKFINQVTNDDKPSIRRRLVKSLRNTLQLGRIDLIECLFESNQYINIKDPDIIHIIIDSSVHHGFAHILEWLIDIKQVWLAFETVDNYIDIAARHGYLELIKILHHNSIGSCTTSAIEKAAANGHFEVVLWLCMNKNEGFSSRAIEVAERNGHMDIVQFLQQYNRNVSNQSMDNASISYSNAINILKSHTNKDIGRLLI
ncbi:peptidase C1A family protein [Heterostelium album PN500]|uniref:Peptidase C1A family protein n=1 Tax=Heterostelium pallidum (strain ATCC 26659 / Pp 5 / PN500) TaxID=670386 RepID=D3B6I1_HETP5|nr:peptidase C1A family protein [Heterostelium album PN500]EFA82951.1 peptidase C1A family protein [Heterostelium album PN500]|eukprot:XP_020435068.1 peptidase C1A family protein [Heterostelium album PN500]